MQPARQHVGPAIVAVERGVGTVGNGVAKTHDNYRVVRRHHVDGVEEIPGCRRQRKCVVSFVTPVAPGARRREVRRGQRLGVPGHRTARAGDMKADEEPADRPSSDESLFLTNGRFDRIADRHASGRNRDARLSALESHGAIRSGNDIAAGALQADEHTVERHGRSAEHVAEANPDRAAPQVGLDGEAERLIDGARGGRLEGCRQIGLCRRISRRVRAVRRCRPRRDPLVCAPRRLRERSRVNDSHHDREDRDHCEYECASLQHTFGPD